MHRTWQREPYCHNSRSQIIGGTLLLFTLRNLVPLSSTMIYTIRKWLLLWTALRNGDIYCLELHTEWWFIPIIKTWSISRRPSFLTDAKQGGPSFCVNLTLSSLTALGRRMARLMRFRDGRIPRLKGGKRPKFRCLNQDSWHQLSQPTKGS